MMTMKLSTTLIHLNSVSNPISTSLVKQFYEYLKEMGTSENYQNQNLKQLINFAIQLGEEKTLYEVSTKEEIVSFINTKIKNSDLDPE